MSLVAAAFIALFSLAAACSRPTPPALTREAFLTFDNLTGDASLDWIAQAAPQILAHDLTGVPKIAPVVVSSVRDAYLNRASRMVHGYYESRSGKLHFEIAVEDAVTHGTLQTGAENGPPGEALNRAAKSLASGARTFAASEPAIAAWGAGDFERAVMLDPAFTQAWVSWAQQLASINDKVRALDLVQRALAQPHLDSPIDKARLELASASFREDDAARLNASRALAALIPYDPSVLAAVAELDLSARNFAQAAKDYQRTLDAERSNTGLLNQLGYAQALAGDLDGASKSFAEYGRGPGEDAVNSLDSMGEAWFINGKFPQAQEEFERAYRKDPKFLDGEPLWKAAHARWLAAPQDTANIAAADKIAETYFALRAAAQDPLLNWRRATWFYETGRRQQAVDLLSHGPASNPAAALLAKQQLQVWNSPLPASSDPTPSNLGKLKDAYLHSDPVNDGLSRTLYAAALLHAGRNNDARDLLERWPLPPRGESPFESLLYPEYLDLRKQLD